MSEQKQQITDLEVAFSALQFKLRHFRRKLRLFKENHIDAQMYPHEVIRMLDGETPGPGWKSDEEMRQRGGTGKRKGE